MDTTLKRISMSKVFGGTFEHQFHTTASEIVLVGLAAGLNLGAGRLEKKKDIGGEGGDLRVHVSRSIIPFSDRFEIEIVKDGSWSPKEVDNLVSTFTLQLTGVKVEHCERQRNEFAALVGQR